MITVPGDVGAEVGVVVGPGGGGLAADAADVGLLARVHLGNTQSALNLLIFSLTFRWSVR